MEHEKITAILPVKEFDEDHFIFMATANGTVKKTALSAFSRPMSKGIIAVKLEDGDYLIGVALTDGKQDMMLFSDAGKAVRFARIEVRAMGRAAAGVRGMKLAKGQHVISLLTASDEKLSVLTATENGYGKRTPIAEYTRHGRGTQGMIAIQASERNGKLVAAQLVNNEDEIMLITTGGVLIRTRVSEIREHGPLDAGRATDQSRRRRKTGRPGDGSSRRTKTTKNRRGLRLRRDYRDITRGLASIAPESAGIRLKVFFILEL